MTVGPAVVVEASESKVYPMVTLASASTLSVSMVRTLRGGEGLLKGLGGMLFGRAFKAIFVHHIVSSLTLE